MGYTALYRQYRPLTFDGVAGQQHITTTLKNQVIGDRVAHAYLFAGTRGTGKTSTARVFARAVNCLNLQRGNPCNSCKLCSRALEGKLMDIIEIDAASNRGVDEIRDLREKVKYPPAEGRYRVYIIDEVHMLTAEAFNALLKTLEEPPAHVIFILATTEPHRLPATVLSRCQRFDFKRIPATEITDLLKRVAGVAGIDIEDDALVHIARCADGSARDALSLLDKCSTFAGEHLTLERVVSVLGMANEGLLFGLSEELSRRNSAGCITLLNQAVQEGRDIGQLFKDIIHHLRDILIAKVAPSSLADMTGNKRDRLLATAGATETNTLIRWINILSEAEVKAKWSTYPEVLLEVALVRLCEPSMDPSLEGVIDRLSRLEDIVLRDGTVCTAPGALPVKKEEDVIPAAQDGADDGTGDENEAVKGCDGNSGHNNISLAQMEKAWDSVLKRLERTKKGLYTILEGSRPVEINGTTLVVGCDALHGIYHDIANRKGNKDALGDVVHSVTGARFEIRIEDNLGNGGPPREDTGKACSLYEEAVQVFGSDLVESLDDTDN